jgi:hypothetical protein
MLADRDSSIRALSCNRGGSSVVMSLPTVSTLDGVATFWKLGKTHQSQRCRLHNEFGMWMLAYKIRRVWLVKVIVNSRRMSEGLFGQ